MRCPFCGHDDSQVKDSRPTEDNSAIRRRRQCEACGGRFTTFERIQLRELTVVKTEGKREPFEREKLERSLSVACRKRPVDSVQIEKLASGMKFTEGPVWIPASAGMTLGLFPAALSCPAPMRSSSV